MTGQDSTSTSQYFLEFKSGFNYDTFIAWVAKKKIAGQCAQITSLLDGQVCGIICSIEAVALISGYPGIKSMVIDAKTDALLDQENKNPYRQQIIAILNGEIAGETIPAERIDWQGIGGLLALYNQTSGQDRTKFVHAIGEIIRQAKEPPTIIAQLVHFVATMDLAELAEDIRHLETLPLANHEDIKDALLHYNRARFLINLTRRP